MTPVYHTVTFEGYRWNQCRVMTKEKGKEITTVIHKLICLHIFCLFFVYEKGRYQNIFSLLFHLTFFFDARCDFHVFLDFSVNGNFSKLARFDRSAEGLWP